MNLKKYIQERQLQIHRDINKNLNNFDKELFNNMNLYLKKLHLDEYKNIKLNDFYDIIEVNGELLKSFLIFNENNSFNIRFNWFSGSNNSSIKSIIISNELFNENKIQLNGLLTIYLNKDNYENSFKLFNVIEKLFNNLNESKSNNIILNEKYINECFKGNNIAFNFLENKKEINKNIKKINIYIKENLDNKYFIEHFNKNLDINNNKKTYINISFNNHFNKVNL